MCHADVMAYGRDAGTWYVFRPLVERWRRQRHATSHSVVSEGAMTMTRAILAWHGCHNVFYNHVGQSKALLVQEGGR